MSDLVKFLLLGSVLFAGACSSAPSQAASDPDDVELAEDASFAVFETSLIKFEERGRAGAQQWSIDDRMKAYGVPGVGLAILEGGEIVWAKGYGALSASSSEQVDSETVFSAGSVSKLINAALILRLVQEKQLDLDENVNAYLTSWKAPEQDLAQHSKVTLRMLLSHTAGFSQHGFPDFQPGEDLPTTIQTLNGTPPAKHGPIRLLFEPGKKMKYSGGGVTVSQLVVEDVTGLAYPRAAQKYVFEPLGMTRSTFLNPLPQAHGNIAKAHDENGVPRALPRGYEAMPEMAASGLWTSAGDMAIFMRSLLNDGDFLSEAMRDEMLLRAPRSWHGLGPRINGSAESLAFHHGGANNSYQAWVEGHPHDGDGIVILTNGEDGRLLAYEIRVAAEGVLGWKIRFPDDFDEPEFE